MPTFWPVCMLDGIWWILSSRIRLRTAGVPIRISSAAMRPPARFLQQRLRDHRLDRLGRTSMRICSCCAAGKTSMMRSTVFGALEVCSVPNTRWPVSAAVSASEMVSRSRISPTRMTSGSSRSAPRSAAVNDSVCAADLALVDQALLRGVHELDRILDGEDVALVGLVDVVDHRRQRGRLAGAGRAGDQHQPLLLVAELLQDRRQAEILERHDLGRDGAEDRALAAAAAKDVDAEAGDVAELEREVDIVGFLERLAQPYRS